MFNLLSDPENSNQKSRVFAIEGSERSGKASWAHITIYWTNIRIFNI